MYLDLIIISGCTLIETDMQAMYELDRGNKHVPAHSGAVRRLQRSTSSSNL